MKKNYSPNPRKCLLRKDIINLFKSLFTSSTGPATVGDIAAVICDSGAPRFYVSYDLAQRQIARISRGLPLTEVKGELKKQMYYDIYRLWQKRCAKKYTSGGAFPFSELYHVLDEPAPSFYLSKSRVVGIIYKERKRKK